MFEDRDDNLVPQFWACPRCGERDMDYLLHVSDAVSDDVVECEACGCTYEVLYDPPGTSPCGAPPRPAR